MYCQAKFAALSLNRFLAIMTFTKTYASFAGLAIVLLFISQTFAQKINFGGGLGGMNYKGDYTAGSTPNPLFFRPGGHVFFRYNMSKSVSLRANAMTGYVTANDAYSSDPFQQIRNQSFRTSISELGLMVEYNFLNYGSRRQIKNWTPYLVGGLAYYTFDPTVQTHTYKTSGLVFPFGVGVKYEIRRPWSVEVEFGTRKLNHDNLDNLGQNAANASKYLRGNTDTNDTYYYLSLGVSYTFYNIWCPED
jgi:Domain of unknown function (DUF6089)